jgi:hypothetical protein
VFQVHDVPMCRQRIDPAEWEAHGGPELGDCAAWSDRGCGMAALRMILLAYLGDAPPLTELVKTGVREGVLTSRGWLHSGIARMHHLRPDARKSRSHPDWAVRHVPSLSAGE